MDLEDLNLKEVVQTYSALILKIGLLVVVLSTLFLFTNLFTEIFDTPKFLILVIFTAVALLLLAARFTVLGKVVFIRTPLDIPLVLLLAVGIVSTILSPAPYISVLGSNLKISSSLVSLVTYVLFYFVLVNSLKEIKGVKWLFSLTIIAAQVLAVLTLLTYAGIKILPIAITPIGSSFSASAILALLIPFVVVQILGSSNLTIKLVNASFLTLMGLTIALTGTPATWIGAIFGLGLTIFVSNLRDLSNLGNLKNSLNLISVATPLVIIGLITALSFIPPMGKAKNPIYNKAQNFPKETQLGLIPSWKISVSAFRDLPFWGSGPGTYLSDFTTYKPVEFNSTKFWNLRFDSSFNEYLQTLATLGGVGLAALLSLTALFIASAVPVILQTKNEHSKSDKFPLAIAGLTFFVILALHAASLPVWIIGILILAAFMITNLSEGTQKNWNTAGDFKSTFLRIAGNVSAKDTSLETIRIDALPGALLAAAILLVGFTAYFGGKLVLADYHHRIALNALTANQGIIAYNEFIAAEKLNPVNDLYRTDLAQTNFALANAIASAKGPTEASPSGSLSDQDKQNIQLLLSQSINEAKTATTLNPKSAQNWEILAQLYKQISGVAQNALVFSLDSYGKAIFQDPLNPNLRLNVGGVYYAIKNYDMAIRFFTDAVNLKPDWANGYYNLSVALKDKGDLNSAVSLAEKVLTLIDQSSPDYKIAKDYLADLKAKVSSGASETNTPSQLPVAEEGGALQKKELPKVINLPKPEKIATPEAIKKPEVSPTPTPTPTTTP